MSGRIVKSVLRMIFRYLEKLHNFVESEQEDAPIPECISVTNVPKTGIDNRRFLKGTNVS